MEELEIGDYINDINSYHLHMFDKHDVTTKKLDVIVEKAGKVDANYAAQIEGYCSLLGEYGKKFETVCAMLALDLIGVKVFRYSDETAEAVASGEKLLKESGTIYESFADMMSPENAKRYLDFLERWKQRRIDRCRAGRSGNGRYNMEVLQEDRIMYRAGNVQNPYGRWFTSEDIMLCKLI